MTPHAQLPMLLPNQPRRESEVEVVKHQNELASRVWLGLILDHWQLFDALEAEWLSPVEGTAGRILPVRAFPVADVRARQGHRIGTYLEVDPQYLPPLDVHVLRGGNWRIVPINDVRNDDEAIYWYGALPSTAITRVVVSNTEEQTRLMRLTREVSNISLPSAVGIRSTEREWSNVDAKAPDHDLAGVVLPPHFDAIRGATTMAVWAIPPIDPWLDILVTSLACPPKDLSESSRVVEAPWWSFPPWIHVSASVWPSDMQSRLWLAAIELFRCFDRETGVSADGITREIARRAIEGAGCDPGVLDVWVDETLSILRADTVVNLDDWKKCPVGKAIQLVLVRPEPAHFKTWADDLPGVSPAVWWSAAALCGLLHGYKRLELSFRGGLDQRRFLSNHALAVGELKWTERLFQGSTLTWHRLADQFVFTFGDEHLWEKPQRARARWFQADLTNDVVRTAAEELARRLGWSWCIENDVHFSDCKIMVSGSGSPRIIDEPARWIEMEGHVALRLPGGVRLVPVFNAEKFRHCIAIEAGAHLPMPPRPYTSGVARHDLAGGTDFHNKPMILSVQSREDGRFQPDLVDVPGLRCVENFLTEEDEAKLIKIIDNGEWLNDLTRRVQHYGWRYGYKARALDASMRLGPLPGWAKELADRLVHEGLVTQVADQVIVNEYIENQGISKHIDCTSCFADGIATISLLESWEMIFAEARGGKHKRVQTLERRSVAVMSGDARYKWTHEILKRKKEPNGFVRKRRISVTFRKVNEATIRKMRGEETGADEPEEPKPENG